MEDKDETCLLVIQELGRSVKLDLVHASTAARLNEMRQIDFATSASAVANHHQTPPVSCVLTPQPTR